MENKGEYPFSQEKWEHCIEVLQLLKDNPFNNPDNQQFSGLIKKIYKEAKKTNKKLAELERKAADLVLSRSTVIFDNAVNNRTEYTPASYQSQPEYKVLENVKSCYCCTRKYNKLHFHYHKLCPSCAEQNYNYRFTSVDLKDKNVILTGGRVKVGYATALKLLNNGANLTLTTRFPALALEQFKKEKNYSQWKHRLFIYGLDLRNIKAVHAFVEYYKHKFETLDVLINNAAQTIKYTDEYYKPLLDQEQSLLELQEGKAVLRANETSVLQHPKQLQSQALTMQQFDLNRFGQPVDERLKNSWNSRLEEISTLELMEVNLINHISPYILIKELAPLLKASENQFKFVINVTSSEGQFSYSNKTVYHPHTNMTKAALNMLTRTSAEEYKEDNISMTSVDVGWISTGAIEPLRKRQFEEGYIPPLDPVDGASRILHPIIMAQNYNQLITGCLLKNFTKQPW